MPSINSAILVHSYPSRNYGRHPSKRLTSSGLASGHYRRARTKPGQNLIETDQNNETSKSKVGSTVPDIVRQDRISRAACGQDKKATSVLAAA